MAGIRHPFQSELPDGAVTSVVRPSNSPPPALSLDDIALTVPEPKALKPRRALARRQPQPEVEPAKREDEDEALILALAHLI